MSYEEHRAYVIPCPNPTAVANAMRTAQQMIARTQRRLQAVTNVPEDPRTWTPEHQMLVNTFKIRPGTQSASQVFDIKGRFSYLAQAATRARAVCVSRAHPMCGKSGELGHAAFAEVGVDGAPTLYLCPAFFRNGPAEQARTIVHELAHARLGVQHRGGVFVSFDAESPLTVFEDAIENAYSYDLLANSAAQGR